MPREIGWTQESNLLWTISKQLQQIAGLAGGGGGGTITGGGANGQVTFWNGATSITGSNNLFWDSANSRLGIGTNVPLAALDVRGNIYSWGTTPLLAQIPSGWGGESLQIQSGVTQTGSGIGVYSIFKHDGAGKGWAFAQGATVCMQIAPAGNVSIGTTTNDGVNRLQVSGGVNFGGSTGLTWDNVNGRLGIGTNVPATTAHVNGDLTIGGGTQNYTFSKRANLVLTIQSQNSDTIQQTEYYTKDGDGTDDNGFSIFAVGIPSNIVNFEQFRYYYSSTLLSYVIGTNKGGTGIYRDIRIGNSSTPTDLVIKANTGSVLVNTTTDNGTDKLQVNGGTLLKGSGNTSATTALTVQNSDGTNMFRVRNDQYIFGNIFNIGTTIGNLIRPSSGYGAYLINGQYLSVLFSGFDTAGFGLTLSGYNIATRTATSGISGTLNLFHGFAPTSGTGTFTMLQATGTINQTGGANGITRGLYVNPTLTAAADFRAIETSAGNIVFGNLPTSSAGLPAGALWNNGGVVNIV